MIRSAKVFTAFALVVGMIVGSSAVWSAVPSDDLLSPTGARAIVDLRECIASKNSVDVYYLLDASGSLKSTDPEFVRADLIANSLSELARVRDGIALNFAVGFFGTTFSPAIGWTSVAGGSERNAADEVAAAVRNQPSLGWTDWREAVLSAQDALSERRAVSDSCQMLVWLTDGGINTDGNDDGLDDAAVNDLCGKPVTGGTAPTLGRGPFNELRQAQVVVLGILLNVPGATDDTRDERYRPFMRPLVEGQGSVSGKETDCGESPIPEAYAAGAFVEATSADSLARVFLSLSALIASGSSVGIRPDGTFDVDKGVSKFSLVTSVANWKLEDPLGNVFGPDSLGTELVESISGGVHKVDFSRMRDSQIGEWTWRVPDPTSDSLYYYSGLAIELDEPETFLAGSRNQLQGRLVRSDDLNATAEDYQFDLTLTLQTPAGLQKIHTTDVKIDNKSGEFDFSLDAKEASGSVILVVTVDELKTKPNNIDLAPLAVTTQVTVSLPDQYPTLTPEPLVLSDLVGSEGTASATLVIEAPRDGSVGEICFEGPGSVDVTSDSSDRDESWAWSGIPDVCVSSGQSLLITARNPISANSRVSATIPVTYTSAGGDELTGTLPISFDSTRPIDAATFSILFFVLLVLGLLLPLVALWLFTYFTHRIQRGSGLLRMSESVRVTADGEIHTSTGAAARTAAWGTDQFKFLESVGDARSVADAGLGGLKAQMPFNPFARPWFVVRATPQQVILGPASYVGQRDNRAVMNGRAAGFTGDIGRLWGVSISESDLRAGPSESGYPATLVVYVRNERNDRSVFERGLAEAFNAGNLKARMASVRAHLVEEQGATQRSDTAQRAQGDRGGAVPNSGSRDARTDGPPPPRGAGPSPARGAAPPQPTNSRLRSGSTPAPPPKRSGDDPPPRRR